MKDELHKIVCDGVQVREQEEGSKARVVEGYAIMFGVRSRVVGYDWSSDCPIYEVIEPGACDQEFLDLQDIILNLSHNDERMLARSVNGEGTLSYSVDETGVKFRAEMPDTVDGDYAWEHVKLRNLTACSFAFTLTRDNYSLERAKDDEGNDIIISHVKSFNSINDMAIVRHPAYEQTSCETRAAMYEEDLKKEETRDESKTEEEEMKVAMRKQVKSLRKQAKDVFRF